MNYYSPGLDIEKLKKVVALMRGGASDGERAAAKNRAEAIAAKPGLSLKTAVSILDGQKLQAEGKVRPASR